MNRVDKAFTTKPNTKSSDLEEEVMHTVEGWRDGLPFKAQIYAKCPVDAIAKYTYILMGEKQKLAPNSIFQTGEQYEQVQND